MLLAAEFVEIRGTALLYGRDWENEGPAPLRRDEDEHQGSNDCRALPQPRMSLHHTASALVGMPHPTAS